MANNNLPEPLYRYSRELTSAEAAELNSRETVRSPMGYGGGVFNYNLNPTEPLYKYNSLSQQSFSSGGSNLLAGGVTATPPAPSTRPPTPSTPPVKTAPIDTILFDDETVPIDTMADLIFENIGGRELINITRSDIVNGQKISYQPIKNLSSIQQRYNPNNILSLQQTADKYFAGFSIKLENKIPNEGNGPNGKNIYFNDSGDLVIEFININSDEQIEIQITTGGTIYNIDLGDNVS
jgi:hypothetical protein